jgi:FMN phosphatase YigB (HAD superfamily)
MLDKTNLKAIVFDWGDTIMRDFSLPGPMSQWEKVEWVDGAERSLAVLTMHYTCIIATSADHSDTGQMKFALSRVGADKYFDLFYSQKELGHKKPDVRFFEAVLRLSGFSPEETIMVGNLYDKDIEGAKKAGMTTIFFNEKGEQGTFSAADYVIGRMDQLIHILANDD